MTSTTATLPAGVVRTTRGFSLRTAGVVAGAAALVATTAVIGLSTDGTASARQGQQGQHARHGVAAARSDAAESAHGTGTTLSTGTGQALRGSAFPAVRPDATELVHGSPGSLSDAAGRPVTSVR